MNMEMLSNIVTGIVGIFLIVLITMEHIRTKKQFAEYMKDKK